MAVPYILCQRNAGITSGVPKMCADLLLVERCLVPNANGRTLVLACCAPVSEEKV
jgi:hypothetical protein